MPTGRYIGRFFVTGDTIDMRARGRDEPAEGPLLKERKFNEGNRTYVLSMPAGSYEAEDDEEAGAIHVHRSGGVNGGSEHICSLPAGTYEIDNDETGAHIFRVPDRENVRLPLEEGEPVGSTVGDSTPAILRQMNLRNKAFYSGRSVDEDPGKVSERALHTGIVAGSAGDTTPNAISRLRAINAKNRQHDWSRHGR
jgi:hypothetical protein